VTTPSASFYLWFIGIIVMIPLVLWLFKRSQLGRHLGGMHHPAPMRIVSSLPLSPSQRIVTVEVGEGEERRWLVLGITPSSITTLHSLSATLPSPSTQAAPPPQDAFHQLLNRLRSGDNREG